jgi:hypothetical protein
VSIIDNLQLFAKDAGALMARNQADILHGVGSQLLAQAVGQECV